MNKADVDKYIKLLPSSEQNLNRLLVLSNSDVTPRIAVFGNFNHGKSTLLNAIVGYDHFKTSDQRQTTENEEHECEGVIWVDTPGLNADINGNDDQKAMIAVFEIADYLMIVHNVKSGELDRSELDVYKRLMRQDKNYKAKMILVLTHMEQVTEQELQIVQSKIQRQLPGIPAFPVSSVRFLKGTKEKKEQLVAKSGMPQLLDYIHILKSKITEKRENEYKRLKQKVIVDMDEKRKHLSGEIARLREINNKRALNINTEIERIFGKTIALLEG